jgi:hypothetical protein
MAVSGSTVIFHAPARQGAAPRATISFGYSEIVLVFSFVDSLSRGEGRHDHRGARADMPPSVPVLARREARKMAK